MSKKTAEELKADTTFYRQVYRQAEAGEQGDLFKKLVEETVTKLPTVSAVLSKLLEEEIDLTENEILVFVSFIGIAVLDYVFELNDMALDVEDGHENATRVTMDLFELLDEFGIEIS